jgi:hypothetical protein
MKIIVSHDVDHLYRDDHYADLIYPKLWIRETLALLKCDITSHEWYLRMLSPFQKRRHHIEEVMLFDEKHGVPSTFFWGMATGLGLSYRKSKAIPNIKDVNKRGFDVGVHGIAYNNISAIKKEYEDFRKLNVVDVFGIREHYVRFDKTTFNKLAEVGYLYDASEFDKKKGYCVKKPYRIDGMWEFPLTIMDGYLPKDLQGAKDKSCKILDEAEKYNLPYASILFHDYLYSDAYSVNKNWYEWIIEYCLTKKYEFISYKNAIKELEEASCNE